MNLLLHVLIYVLTLSILLYISLVNHPRTWLHRMPPEVVSKVPARTPAEKQRLLVSGLPFLAVMLAYPVVYVLTQNTAGFAGNFLILYAFFAGFTIWDTLVIDLLIFCTLTPGFLIIPGTTRADYANKKYHLLAGAKGLGISLVFAVILAAILTLF